LHLSLRQPAAARQQQIDAYLIKPKRVLMPHPLFIARMCCVASANYAER
jgi:hypothetical protein